MYDDVTAALFSAAWYRCCYWAVVVGAKGAKDLLLLVVCSKCAQTYYVCYVVVHDVTVAGDPGSLFKGRQSCGKLHRVQDLRKEATTGASVYVQ